MNFDAWRLATVGPLEYLCRDRVKPSQLVGLWQIGNGDYADKSRYGGGNIVGSTAFSATSEFSFPMVTSASEITFSCAFGTTLNMTEDWTLEYYTYGKGGFTFTLTSGPIYLQIRPASNSQDYYTLKNAGASVYTGFPVGNTQNTLAHFAYVYRAGSGLTVFRNGSVAVSSSITIAQSSASLSFQMSANSGFSNVRVVQKALGTSTTYPVPTTFYTGYESI